MKHSIFAVLFTVSLFLQGFAQESEKLSDFDELTVAGPFKVNLIASNKNEIIIDYNDYDEDDISIEERAGELKLKIRTRSMFDREYDFDRYIEIDLFYKELDDISASMGAEVFSEETLKTRYLDLEISMGGEIELDVEVEEIDIAVNMGGEAHIKGSTELAYVSTSMGGEIDAERLTAKEVSAKTNMGGVIGITAIEKLEAHCSLGGEIYYYGNPEFVDTNTSMGGYIKKKKTSN